MSGEYTSLIIGVAFGAAAFGATVWHMKVRKSKLPPEPPTYSDERQHENGR